jgi:small conductance mechanosensitive channel
MVYGAVALPGTLLAQTEAAEQLCVAFEGSTLLCELIATVAPSELVALTLADLLPRLFRITLVLILAWVLNRVARRMIKRFIIGLKTKGIERLGTARSLAPLADTAPLNLQRATMRTETIGGVLRSLATVAIWTVAILMVLAEFDVSLGPLIAGAGIVGIALGFGAQKLVQDFLSGIFLLMEDQYGIGDIVDVGEATGTVEGISLRTTRLRDVYGVVWHVPNGEVRRVGNMSQLWARAVLDVGVAYDTDVDYASEVILRVARDLYSEDDWHGQFIEEPEVWGIQDLGENEVKIRFVVKVVPGKQWAIERELRARLKRAFDAEGIEIPFPQRTVWVRQPDGQPAASLEHGDAREHEWGPPAS